MIQLCRFNLYYFSEVSADILFRYLPDRGVYKISATHERDNIPISDWFHFVSSDIKAKDDPLHFESKNAVEPVAKMAGRLSPGAEHILERYDDVDDAQLQFFVDFMCAMTTKEYNIADNREIDYYHPAGEWLLEEYRELDQCSS